MNRTQCGIVKELQSSYKKEKKNPGSVWEETLVYT